MKGLRKYLPPFAPDISGASSVLYEMGGILVICDAGGCTGNVCGFDEPRWFLKRSCIFSAGLRDMDAVFGRDDRLAAKLEEACSQIEAAFVCVIGTPVPAVIGTDYRALKRMLETKVHLPVFTVETTGIRQYDAGEEMAYMELFRTFAQKQAAVRPGTVGILGATPLDVSDLDVQGKLRHVLSGEGIREVYCYGMGDGLSKVQKAGEVEKNLVLSPAALAAAKYLEAQFGTPYEARYPLAERLLSDAMEKTDVRMILQNAENGTWEKQGRYANILILHQQVLANGLRKALQKRLGPESRITVASFFLMKDEWMENGDIRLREEEELFRLAEDGAYTLVAADGIFRPMFGKDVAFIDIPHFACSGRLCG